MSALSHACTLVTLDCELIATKAETPKARNSRRKRFPRSGSHSALKYKISNGIPKLSANLDPLPISPSAILLLFTIGIPILAKHIIPIIINKTKIIKKTLKASLRPEINSGPSQSHSTRDENVIAKRTLKTPPPLDVKLWKTPNQPHPTFNENHTAWLSAYENRIKSLNNTHPNSPPIHDENHIAWLSAYENRVKTLNKTQSKPQKSTGWIYAYTFSSCQRDDRPYPIKVGQTRQGVEKRVHEQCKGTAVFERPVILGKWKTSDPRGHERAIHQELRRMGCNDTDGHGTEWFHATPELVEKAVISVLIK
ncbi:MULTISPECIES: GIY-YIG nuclease family protein [unclassified Pseudomonas]|uniref:GIY-YIG nuclease family protein n=1 Tax=Pseudomonas TaxID=286 RepID=UPI0002A3E924|nr:GIY-YIG nuclease family protein [Pseudomonas sp. UMA643]NTY20929.1 GIY-YIG nuclease family protein [Pseudomonas sp. UMC3103]NTY25742.1 GIY-YIG nuclease family protein [Pseudomonas sp. UMA603]NTY30639.1 GIY-YIG nuclease family protein [Pseudomonas sp. UMC3129]NTY55450.1 GIY-YIG nuclease family protein [Pseudomonas sp. UMC631]NTY66328.1 GIY-YIG nuclease family protein [Pseudomonas sp. UMC3106]NUA33651.1 GIY-YIG nuclease family protein [Pseudomonas sp. UMA601]